MKKFALAALGLAFAASATPALAAETANYCPAGGAIRFGVEPFESNTILLPIYSKIDKLISAQVGCPVQLYIATSYNAEIEAMRAGKLEMGEFGPLGYVLAHQVADARRSPPLPMPTATRPPTPPPSPPGRARASPRWRRSRAIPSAIRTPPPPRATCSRPTRWHRPASIRTRA